MAWVAVHKSGSESIFAFKPFRTDLILWEPEYWTDEGVGRYGNDDTDISLPKGTIKKLIGKDLTWEDNPVELKET